jgi:alpha-galactosidase
MLCPEDWRVVDTDNSSAAYGNEVRDLETWRSWGYEKMLKYDNCYIPYDNLTQENEYGRFKRMQDAILQVAAKHNEDPWM